MSARFLQTHFVRSFLWQNFDLNSLERFAILSQQTLSTSLLKNLQKTGKCYFQTLTTFVFEPKVARHCSSKKLPFSKFSFKKSWTLRLTFPENNFNLVNQNFGKNWKMRFSNTHNILENNFNSFFKFAKYWKILFSNAQNIIFCGQEYCVPSIHDPCVPS